MQISGSLSKPGPSSKPATLEDIAKIAGVDRRTVRNALHNTGRISPATRENVLRIAQELQYEPNLHARALVTGKTGRISIVVGKLNQPYNVTLVQHLVDSITHHGYEAMIIQTPDNRPSAQTLRSSLSDGIIVVGLYYFDPDAKNSGVMRDHTSPPAFPCVIIDLKQPSYMDHITIDLGPAVEETLRTMIASGRRRIAYINKRIEIDNQEVRFRTYVDMMNMAGYEPEFIVADEKLPTTERIAQLKAYFQQHGAPEAIFCHSDHIAFFTYRALRDLGYEIPTDSLLVGCDGVEFTDYFDPPLSTITIPWEEVGKKACQFLKQRLDEPDTPIQEHVVIGKLVVRPSLVADN